MHPESPKEISKNMYMYFPVLLLPLNIQLQCIIFEMLPYLHNQSSLAKMVLTANLLMRAEIEIN